MSHQAEDNLRWCFQLLDGLAAAGVRRLVLSPGSRSTPLVLAAERHPQMRLHTLIDERSAGFFALGLSRFKGTPAALVATSGSAPAHWYPAVIEANQGQVPLILLSADRPPELRDWGANQSIDQFRLFGTQTRAFHDPGPARADAAGLRFIHQLGRKVVRQSRWPRPGPVHINLPLREPLVPKTEVDLPAGDFCVQAVLHRYETFQLATGHTVKLPMDRGEGQQWNRAPGNLYSTPRRVRVEAGERRRISIGLDRVMPPIEEPADLERVMDVVAREIDGPGLQPASGGHLGYISGGGIYPGALGDYLAAVTNRYAGVHYAGPGAVHLENMLKLSNAGAVIMPASPGFYHGPRSVGDLVDFVVARVLDHMDVDHAIGYRWTGEEEARDG